MSDLDPGHPRRLVERVESTSTVHRTPCGAGTMAWREWGAGPLVVLLHGGFGSWLHWVRNVEPLSRRFRVLAADLPGLGDSDAPPSPATPESLGRIVHDGLVELAGDAPRVHLVGFSFGGLIGGQVAMRLGDRAATLTLVGASGLDLPRPALRLVRREDAMDEDARASALRHNLMALMLHDENEADALALHVHAENDRRARLRSRRMSLGSSLRDALPLVRADLHGIWGEHDATTGPYLDERRALIRSIDGEARFEVVPGAGHWVQYEAAEEFNRVLSGILDVYR